MPCAPARTEVSAALITLGIPISRVLRSSATLFTLTLSLVIYAAQCLPEHGVPTPRPSVAARKNRDRYCPRAGTRDEQPGLPHESRPYSARDQRGCWPRPPKETGPR